MGSHTFTWDQPAQEVYVTGSFDNWSKSVKLEKHGDSFHKTVDLPAQKIFYKFVVDGEWVTDPSRKQETDDQGLVNNVVDADELSEAPASHSFVSSAAPQSTTADLAGQQPLEKELDKDDDVPGADSDLPLETPGDDLPGAFPITPANDLQQFFAKPIPASEGAGNPIKLAPGEPVPDPSTFNPNTIHSTVRDDPELKKPSEQAEKAVDPQEQAEERPEDQQEQAFGVNPIPATGGIGNPIKLAPGEPVPEPSTLTGNTVDSTVSHTQYGVSDTGAPVLPPVLDKQSEAEANGASMFGIPPVSSSLIPESSLPMGDSHAREPAFEPSFTTSSAGPEATTAQLAAQVPLEPRGVPEVVSDSQETAHSDPEAASSAKAVQNKSELEDELLRKVPEEPAIAESGPVTGVPQAVADSQQAAHADPEAAAYPEAVREKAALEDELKQTVPEESATSAPPIIPEAVSGGVAAAGATLIGAALLAKDKATEAYNQSTEPTPAVQEVPDIVTESQDAAHVSPEASAEPEAVHDKAAFEDELKHVVPEAPATSESGILGNTEGGLTGKLAAGATAASVAVADAAYTAKDKATDVYGQSAPAYNQSTEPAPFADDEVPEVVTESQHAAHVSPEASAEPEAVHDKAVFEDELKHKVPEAPATSESGLLGNSESGLTGKIAAGATAASAAVAGAAYTARDKAADTYESYAGQPFSDITSEPTVDGSVPDVVLDSQEKAHVAPEASANPEAVREKTAFEGELKSEVLEAPATSESGTFGRSEQGISGKAAAGIAAGTAAVAGAAYTARDQAAEATGRTSGSFLPASIQNAIDSMNRSVSPAEASSSVPEVVTDSQHAAHVAPEASAEPEAVAEKSEMERELLSRVPQTDEASAPAPTESAALSAVAPVHPTGSAALDETTVDDVPPVTSSLPIRETETAAPTGVVAVDDVQPQTSLSSAVPDEPGLNTTALSYGAPTGASAAADVSPITPSSSAPVNETPVSVESTPAATGLNAPADSQAQTLSTKAEQLAAPDVSSAEPSRDVSPMTRPESSSKKSEPVTTTGIETSSVPTTSGAAPVTPQKSASKRASGFFRGSTPEGNRPTSSDANKDTQSQGGTIKKRGFLAKLKEKFKA